jgi:hypothetical protein
MDRVNDIVVNGALVLILQRHVPSKLLSLPRHIVLSSFLEYSGVPWGSQLCRDRQLKILYGFPPLGLQ